jgi:hypothetical protein
MILTTFLRPDQQQWHQLVNVNTCCKDGRKARIMKASVDFAGPSQSDVPNQ